MGLQKTQRVSMTVTLWWFVLLLHFCNCREMVHYDSSIGKTSGISACFDSSGKKVLALRRRLPPVLYNTHNEQAICQFYHPQYYNSCTMKTCSFAGENDEYILSGSDDFNLYMWRVPEDDGEVFVVILLNFND